MTTSHSRRVEWAAAGLLLTSSCFVAPGTLGNPCVQDQDCDAAQVCQQGFCVDEPEEGSVRVVHAAPDLGEVDIYLSGSTDPLIEGLSYAEASEWLPVEVGTHGFELRPAGADPGDAPLYASEELALAQGDRVSAIAVGLLEGGPAGSLQVLAIREEWGTDLAGRARARIVHAGADAPDLLVDGLDGQPLALSRFADSDPAGVPLDAAGGERIELFAGDELLTAFTTPQFVDGDQVLVIATGLLGSLARDDDGFSLVAVGEDGVLGRIRQDPQLFTLHGARDAGNLENCTNDFEVAANFNYGDIQSSFLSPGNYDFEIFAYPSGCTGTPLNPGGNASGDLDAGERYLLLLTGELTPFESEPALQVATFVDQFARTDDDAKLRFVHGASAEQIYVGNVTDGEIKEQDIYTSPIAWRSESGEKSLAEDFYLLGIADAVDLPPPPLSPLVTFDYTATPGVRAWGIVSGDPSPEDADGFVQLMLVDTATPDWDVQLVDPNP